MSDVREEILERLLAIGNDIAGFVTVKRNITRPSDDRLPAMIVLDADETAEQGDPAGRPSHAPRRLSMTPEIYILHSAKPEEVGPLINALRADLVRGILTDTALRTLVGTNGDIRYEGCSTGLSAGREGMIGDMGLSFTFLYILRPDQLTPTAS